MVWVFGAPPWNPNNVFFGIVQLKHPHPSYPKTPLMAYGIQWYGGLGRHPRIQTIFFGIVQLKQPHPSYPKTPLMAYQIEKYGVWVATLESKQYFLALCSSNIPILGIQKHL